MTIEALAIDQQARTLVEALPVADRVGLLFHPIVMLRAGQDLDEPSPLGPSLRELIIDRGIRFFCLSAIPSPAETAEVTDRLQTLARDEGNGLPLVFSTDPRHSFVQNAGAAHAAHGVSQWPEPLGLGAIGDADEVRRFGRTVRDDYRTMGIRMALHPQVDLTTEARWARQAQSFGTLPSETSRLLRAFLEGLQGEHLSEESVAAVVKHFPGGGAQLDGEDPHFPYGREQVYPAGRFEEHLEPFRAAIDAGAAAIMPYYGVPVGLRRGGRAIPEVGFGYNRDIITGLLREELGYDGMVLSDFGLVTDAEVFGKPFPARAWGVEHLSVGERYAALLAAGVDQFGGEHDTAAVLDLVASGAVSEETITTAAARTATVLIRMGLADTELARRPDAYVLPRVADVAAGRRAQSRAVTVLKYEAATLPIRRAHRVYLDGVSPDALPDGWTVASLEEAELAFIRRTAPFEPRDTYFLEAGMQQGSLDFPDEDVTEIARVAAHAPTVVVVTLTRPAILTEIEPHAAALVGDFGASDAALIDALTGVVPPEGRLPFELPRSMAAVEAAAPDAGADTVDPLFPLGHGLDIMKDA
ncbi:beta-glucosidase [Microbacterium faecale]|uniref:beta-glucosidase n=1 Tax=Microbacterium faecale TaxID=1804630 RepID=A0A916Y0Z3_9MICO|nr:glycoside hydrolase family 3 N-terminal domain-containing protein [Microbacterium faecale]GGD26165.1 beta-glucosidase [Microbacterium faecale]